MSYQQIKRSSEVSSGGGCPLLTGDQVGLSNSPCAKPSPSHMGTTADCGPEASPLPVRTRRCLLALHGGSCGSLFRNTEKKPAVRVLAKCLVTSPRLALSADEGPGEVWQGCNPGALSMCDESSRVPLLTPKNHGERQSNMQFCASPQQHPSRDHVGAG